MKKVLAFALSLVLILGATLPGTLAVSIDADTTANEMNQCTCGTEDGTHAEDCLLNAQPADPAPVKESGEEEGTPEEGEPAEGDETPAPEDEENGADNGENAEPSKEGETPDENAGETAGEGGEEIATPHDLETCNDDCEDCTCVCHLVAKLLVTANVDEFYALADTFTDAQYAVLTQEQLTKIQIHLEAIEPKPAPPVVLEESQEPVASEIYIPTKNFTNVAPFGDPVSGK